jgi:hypothetical protein
MYRIKLLGTINMHSGLQIALLVGFWLWFSGAIAAGAACEQVHNDDVTI